MANDWLTGATRYDSGNGGSLIGGPPRWVWHTYEANPNKLSALNGAKYLVDSGNDVHFTFNPVSGQIVQILPASVSGRGLVNSPGGVETNRMGSACIQVEVIAYAANPWTAYVTPAGRAALATLVAFAKEHGIPSVWPAGPPPAFPSGYSVRSAATWTQNAGHYGHSQVPENDHGDPGALDLNVLFPPQPKPQGVPVGYYLPTAPYRPGDGVLYVDGTGVYSVTKAQWDVLRTEPGVTSHVLPDAQWDALHAQADQYSPMSLRVMLSEIQAKVNALTPQSPA